MKTAEIAGSKILVIGVTGSGKSTLAQRIAKLRHYDHIELDSLYWEKGWKAGDPEAVKERMSNALAGDNWVADGNYTNFRNITWSRADTVIWLDYNMFVIFFRLFCRTMQRILTREKLWNGNQESFAAQFLSKDSLFVWAFKTYFSYSLEYSTMIKKPEHAERTLFRFKTPEQADKWIRREEDLVRAPST